MPTFSRKWINTHREELKEKYDNKTLIVSEDRIVKVLDGAVDPLEINRIAEELCKGKEWDYTYICRKEAYLL
jgi:hypothetical protein